jgi:hypothetical protein
MPPVTADRLFKKSKMKITTKCQLNTLLPEFAICLHLARVQKDLLGLLNPPVSRRAGQVATGLPTTS